MTNEDMVADLKQFISAELRSGLMGVENRLDSVESRLGSVESRLGNLETDMKGVKQGLDIVNERLDTVIDVMGEDIVELQVAQKNHEHRITKLETKAA